MDRSITFTITSCGRLDLLDITLKSFWKYASSDQIVRYVLVEDSGDRSVYEELLRRYPAFEIIFNERRIGPIGALYRAWDKITTPWIFHCEDDWEFLKPGFMEKSFEILEYDPNILQVWLRAITDTNGHPILPEVHVAGSTEYRIPNPRWGKWCGFSTNPGLRRASDQALIDRSLDSEIAISQMFMGLGRYSAILTEPFVKHIGKHKSAYFGGYRGIDSWEAYRRKSNG